jgi:biotin operon repressor
MYGDKEQKNKRLERIKAAVKGRPYGIFQADLARLLGLSRFQISKDLVALHKRGVRLAEDDEGRLFWAE